MLFPLAILAASWDLLLDAAVYILFGITVGGLIKVFLSPAFVARHLGQGRFTPVFKAALLGIPLPLCSCGVLPAAAALKKQGANRGATTAFLISTPESGVDSISITYALLDPIMTVARPVAAFFSALLAGIAENLLNQPAAPPGLAAASCPEERSCGAPKDLAVPEQTREQSFWGKTKAGMGYAYGELWGDLAGWFFIGLLLGGTITALVPEDLISAYLGGGLSAMLLMLSFGIPLYICATASTPIAAALILKGVSPGAALVFLLVGPATNMATLSVLTCLLGRRSVLLYLFCIAATALLAGFAVDALYGALGISARAIVGQAGGFVPYPLQLAAALLVLLLSLKPLLAGLRRLQHRICKKNGTGCGCSNASCADRKQQA